MEIILLYLNVLLFAPADQLGLYLLSGEGLSKEAQKLWISLERWKLLLCLLLLKAGSRSGLPADLYEQVLEGESALSSLLSNPIANDGHFQKNMVISGDSCWKSTYWKLALSVLAQELGFAYGIGPSLRSCLARLWIEVILKLEIVTSSPVKSYFCVWFQHLKKPGFRYFFVTGSLRGPIPSSGSDWALGVRWLAAQTVSTWFPILSWSQTSGEVNDNYHFDSRYVDGKMRARATRIKPGQPQQNTVNTLLESLHYQRSHANSQRTSWPVTEDRPSLWRNLKKEWKEMNRGVVAIDQF